jgi:hypothetical protein
MMMTAVVATCLPMQGEMLGMKYLQHLEIRLEKRLIKKNRGDSAMRVTAAHDTVS